MDRVKDISQLVYKRTQGGEFRWITISTLLIALGEILHLVSPSIGGVTPNWTIATYCMAILLVKPTYKQSLGIGLVVAMIATMTSKAAFPYANFFSEPTGALAAALFANAIGNMKVGKIDIKPAVTTFVVTTISGGIFVTTLLLVLNLPMAVYLFVMWPTVFLVAAVNSVITELVYFPAKQFLVSRGMLSEEDVEISDHSGLVLTPTQEGQISIEHVTYSYGHSPRKALNDVTLAVRRGDFMVITGPSGSGKTTLCMAIVGAVPHFFGGVMHGMTYIDGQATTQTSIANLALHVGTVLADYDTQLVTMTVGEEVAFAMENRGYDGDAIATRTKEVLHQVQLDGLEERKIASLSGGQRQRLAIASVLATEPTILVLDEPTSSLDPEGTEELYRIVKDLNEKQNMTIIVIDDALDAVLPYANRMVLMAEGAIVKDDTVEATLTYMYEHDVYAEAIPPLFKCQMAVAKQGYPVTVPWLTTDTVLSALQKDAAVIKEEENHIKGGDTHVAH